MHNSELARSVVPLHVPARTMLATASFPCYADPRPAFIKSFSIRTNSNSLKLKASLSDYPLASRIMVTNILYLTSESNFPKEFSNFGQIAEVKLVKDEATKRSKGYAFIQYKCKDDAMLALENMDHKRERRERERGVRGREAVKGDWERGLTSKI
ncbi:hypothetical protein L1049_010097 [Liquidambar formosana]|uniref:RRM domain-containing protein n=1 Tax=Liquidambar formosana TaxID=63359 RepID=A0AAP0N973_LIQFO